MVPLLPHSHASYRLTIKHAAAASTLSFDTVQVVTYAGRTAFPGHAKRQAQVAMAASDQSKSLHKELTLINQKLLLHTMRDMVDSSHVQHAATRHDSEAVMHQSKSMQQDHVTARPAYPKAMHIPQSPQEKQALESKPEKSALLQLQPSAIAVASSVMTQSAVTPTSGAGLSIASSGRPKHVHAEPESHVVLLVHIPGCSLRHHQQRNLLYCFMKLACLAGRCT